MQEMVQNQNMSPLWKITGPTESINNVFSTHVDKNCLKYTWKSNLISYNLRVLYETTNYNGQIAMSLIKAEKRD